MCYVNDVVCSMLVFTHCTVTSQGFTVTYENHKGCIFPILSITVPLSVQAKSLIRLLIFTLADFSLSVTDALWFIRVIAIFSWQKKIFCPKKMLFAKYH